jgi:hypothetical protein
MMSVLDWLQQLLGGGPGQQSPYRASTGDGNPAAVWHGLYDDLSGGDIVLSKVERPQIGPGELQRPVWAGPPPQSFWYPVSPYTNPFQTPEYGIQSSPTNPVIEDRPSEIPPGWSETRGEHSMYRRPRSAK